MDLIKILPFTCTVGNQGFTVTVSHLLVGRTAGIIKRYFDQKQDNGQRYGQKRKIHYHQICGPYLDPNTNQNMAVQHFQTEKYENGQIDDIKNY